VSFDTDDATVSRIVTSTLEAGQQKLSEPDALRVLEAYGIPTLPWRFVAADGTGGLATRAAEAAADLGLPVALKVVSRHVVHKTEVGGVALDLESKAQVERAVRDMVKRLQSASAQTEATGSGSQPAIDGILVQAMSSGGTETIVGLTRVERIGALVMFGLGGIYVEVMKDVVLRLAPLLDTDADQMIHEVKMFQLLAGTRGEEPRDLAAIAETILRISQLAERHPRIAEMDINPLIARPKGVAAIDARIQLG
jgi:acyl-CoA synthetase (NDP forming)